MRRQSREQRSLRFQSYVSPDIRVETCSRRKFFCEGAKVIAFPELCITGYTCGDLFSQEILLREAKQGLYRIAEYTKEKDAVIFVGVPYEVAGKLYNTAAALNHGKVLGLVTKTFLPNYGEFYEMRQFQLWRIL